MHRLGARNCVWHIHRAQVCRGNVRPCWLAWSLGERAFSSSSTNDGDTSTPRKGACFTRDVCAASKARQEDRMGTHRVANIESDIRRSSREHGSVDSGDVLSARDLSENATQSERKSRLAGACDTPSFSHASAGRTPHPSAPLSETTKEKGESMRSGRADPSRATRFAIDPENRVTDTSSSSTRTRRHVPGSVGVNGKTGPPLYPSHTSTTPPVILRDEGTLNHVDSLCGAGEPTTAPDATGSGQGAAAADAATASRATASRTGETGGVCVSAEAPSSLDRGPIRATGLWSVEEVINAETSTVDFRRIDDIESDIVEERRQPEEAVVPYEDESAWKYKLMFQHKVRQTPKHLTWKELGEEMECLDCVIEPDEHRPEEVFAINFYFKDRTAGRHDLVWSARNDVSYSEGLTDLLAAIGACLGRSSVHRTIRFDDGQGSTRDVAIRTRSRYTSDIILAFRPSVSYHRFERKQEEDEYAASLEKEGMSPWGFHPSLMDPEYTELDFDDPVDTYKVTMSAHGFCMIVLTALRRLLARPMRDFYRPSQLMRVAKVRTTEDVGLAHAMKGWLGIEDRIYPHYTAIEAVQEHWLGKDAPFSLCAMINKLREMAYLRPENPEFQSWLAVREHDSHVALRNVRLKMLGVGASTLFVPVTHNATVNRLLPRSQQRRLRSAVSLNAMLDLPDETRRLGEFKQLTGHERLGAGESNIVAESLGKGEQ